MISVIIPVYKISEIFFGILKKNKPFFRSCELIIMNDNPEETIAEKVGEIIPKAVTVDNRNNLGFASNVNAGVKIARGEYIFLLNSDVTLIDDSFKKTVGLFQKDKEVFAIAFAQTESGGKIVGSNRGYFKDGLIYHSLNPASNFLHPTSNLWAEGGASLFRKNIFLELGGFDPLYNPFYWEDVDLSYRAWKTGFKVLFYPEVKVRHQHETTIGKYFAKSLILKTAYRNQFIFNWKNLTDRDLLTKHLLNLPVILLKSIVDGNRQLLPGFLSAFFKLPKILKSRQECKKLFIKSDKEILVMFSHSERSEESSGSETDKKNN